MKISFQENCHFISMIFFFVVIINNHLRESRSLCLRSDVAAEDDCTASDGSATGRTTPNTRLAGARPVLQAGCDRLRHFSALPGQQGD